MTWSKWGRWALDGQFVERPRVEPGDLVRVIRQPVPIHNVRIEVGIVLEKRGSTSLVDIVDPMTGHVEMFSSYDLEVLSRIENADPDGEYT